MDVIGLINWRVGYISDEESMVVRLVLARDSTSADHILRFKVSVFFSGFPLTVEMNSLLRTEGIQYKNGFPITDATTLQTLQQKEKVRACKIQLSASCLTKALKSFMQGEDLEFVKDDFNNKGNGIGFRPLPSKSGLVAMLYMLKDNLLIFERPLFGSLFEDFNLTTTTSVFLLEPCMLRAFIGLSKDSGFVDLSFNEFSNGEQQGIFAYNAAEGDATLTGISNLTL